MAVSKKSLANLNRGGRKPYYGEARHKRNIGVTDTGWEGFKRLVRGSGKSIAGWVEEAGRGLPDYRASDIEKLLDTLNEVSDHMRDWGPHTDWYQNTKAKELARVHLRQAIDQVTAMQKSCR